MREESDNRDAQGWQTPSADADGERAVKRAVMGQLLREDHALQWRTRELIEELSDHHAAAVHRALRGLIDVGAVYRSGPGVWTTSVVRYLKELGLIEPKGDAEPGRVRGLPIELAGGAARGNCPVSQLALGCRAARAGTRFPTLTAPARNRVVSGSCCSRRYLPSRCCMSSRALRSLSAPLRGRAASGAAHAGDGSWPEPTECRCWCGSLASRNRAGGRRPWRIGRRGSARWRSRSPRSRADP
jgi:hypothetical protein